MENWIKMMPTLNLAVHHFENRQEESFRKVYDDMRELAADAELGHKLNRNLQ